MKTSYRIFIAILILLFIGFFVTNFFVTKKIKTLLEKESSLSYSSMNVNAFAGSLSLSKVEFQDKEKNIHVDEMYINIDLIHYLLKEKIIVESFDADGINLLFKKNSKTSNSEEKNKDFKIESIKKLKLKNTNIILEDENKIILELSDLNLSAEDMVWPLDEDYEWLKNETLKINAKDLVYDLDKLHYLKTKNIAFENKSFRFMEFKLEPKFSKLIYSEHIETEKDLMDLDSKSIKVIGIDIFKKEGILNFNADKIQIDSTDFFIHRDKTIADDTSIKSLYSEALRNLEFQLRIDSLVISDLNITYEELLDKSKNAGEIKFNSINGQVVNIHNSMQAEQPNIEAKISAKFSNTSDIFFNWTFVPDHEHFYLSTILKQVEDKSINSFFAQAIRMEMEGKIDEISTRFSGNNSEINGNFKINYERLKINVLKKDGSKNNFASLLSNVFVRNNNVDDTFDLEHVERDQTKSFWNYVWTFHLEGLKKSLL